MKVFFFCEVFITSRMTRFLIQFQFTIDIDVVNLEKSWTDKDLTDLSKLLKANLGKKKIDDIFMLQYRLSKSEKIISQTMQIYK